MVPSNDIQQGRTLAVQITPQKPFTFPDELDADRIVIVALTQRDGYGADVHLKTIHSEASLLCSVGDRPHTVTLHLPLFKQDQPVLSVNRIVHMTYYVADNPIKDLTERVDRLIGAIHSQTKAQRGPSPVARHDQLLSFTIRVMKKDAETAAHTVSEKDVKVDGDTLALCGILIGKPTGFVAEIACPPKLSYLEAVADDLRFSITLDGFRDAPPPAQP